MKPFLVSVRNAATTNITTSYTQLVASLGQESHMTLLSVSANVRLIVGIGPNGAEVDHFVIAAGNTTSDFVNVVIPAGSRISIKTVTGTISSGMFAFTFFV